MPKYGRWGQTVSSSSSSDSENCENLQETNGEIEEKVAKILNLIKTKRGDEKEWNFDEELQVKSQLIELVVDFHGEYKSLRALYDRLKEELSKKEVDTEKEKDGSSSSSSSGSISESEYYSPDELSSRGTPSPKSVKRISGKSNSKEGTPTKRKLVFTKENEDTHLEYKEAMIINQELKKTICDLEIETERQKDIIKAVNDESMQLKESLLERENNLESFNETQKAHEKEVLAWKQELERQIGELRDELRVMEQDNERKTVEINQLGKEKSELQNQVLEHERIAKGKEQKLSVVEKKLEDDVKVLNLKVTALVTQINNLELEVETLNTQKGKLEEELESKTIEASGQLKTLMEKSEKEKLVKDDQIRKLNAHCTELENTLKKRDDEAKTLQQKFQNESAEASNQRTLLTDEFNKLKKEFDALQTENSQLEWQFAREKQRSLHCLNEVKTRNTELANIIEQQQLTLKDQEDTISKMIKTVDDFKSKLQNSERKMTEYAEEFCKKLEVNIRLLSQRLRVAEQLHSENTECLKRTKEKYLQEHEILLLYRTKEVKDVKELENVLREKEMAMQELGEEKREAIRQLCMLIDYHRVRYDRLKDWILKLNVRNQKKN